MKLNNGFEIPQIGVGTWTLRGETARQNVRLALQAGFRHVDTAQMYENESEVGLGIADSDVLRSDIFVTTKVSTSIMREGQEAVRQSIDKSLARLNTGYIDLLLIHWPVKGCVKYTWQVMEDYVRQGKVRSIGVSNFNRHHLDDLLSYAEIRPAVNQIEVHPLITQEENIAYNHSLGIQVEAWGPFGQGDIDVIGHPLLQSLAAKYQKTASQALRRRHAGHQRPESEPAFERAQRPRDLPVVTYNNVAMKVIILNGSPKAHGNTATALHEVERTLQQQGIETEWMHVGHLQIHGCIACNKCWKTGICAFGDIVNDISEKMREADGLLVGSPVYFASPNGTLLSLLDRLFYSNLHTDWTMKVGASVSIARRGGATTTMDVLNKYFLKTNMPVVPSQYWSIAHGTSPSVSVSSSSARRRFRKS